MVMIMEVVVVAMMVAVVVMEVKKRKPVLNISIGRLHSSSVQVILFEVKAKP